MIYIIREVPGQYGWDLLCQESGVVGSSLIWTNINFEVLIVSVDNSTGGVHVQVVQIPASLEEVAHRSCSPQCVGIRQSDETFAPAAVIILVIVRMQRRWNLIIRLVPWNSVQSVTIQCGRIRCLLNSHDATGLSRVLTGHIHIQRSDHVCFLFRMSIHPVGCHVHFIAPHEGDSAFRPWNFTGINQLLIFRSQSQQSCNTSSVIAASRFLYVRTDHDSLLRMYGSLYFCDGNGLAFARLTFSLGHRINLSNGDLMSGNLDFICIRLSCSIDGFCFLQQSTQAVVLSVAELPFNDRCSCLRHCQSIGKAAAAGVSGRFIPWLQDVSFFILRAQVALYSVFGSNTHTAIGSGIGESIADTGIGQDDLSGDFFCRDIL